MNPQAPQSYSIQDPVSGKTVTVQGDHAPTQQDAEEIFQKAGLRSNSSQTTTPQSTSGDTISNIPVIGGLTTPFREAGEGLLDLGRVGLDALGIKKITGEEQPTLLSQQEGQQVNQDVQNNAPLTAAKMAVGMGATVAPGTAEFRALAPVAGSGVGNAIANSAIKGGIVGGGNAFSQPDSSVGSTLGGVALGGILGPILEGAMSGKLTQQGVNKAMTAAKNESVASGATKSWNDIATELRSLANEGPNQFKPDLQKEVENIIANRTPADVSVSTDFGPSQAAPTGLTTDTLKGSGFDANQLHNFRKAIDDRINPKYWQAGNIRPVGVEANQLLRQVISNSLHEVAPETELLDAINHIYYKPAFSKMGIPKVGSVKSPLPAGVPTIAANALATILGVTEGRKLLGGVLGK